MKNFIDGFKRGMKFFVKYIAMFNLLVGFVFDILG